MSTKVLCIDDCVPESYYYAHFADRVLVMAPESLKEQYRNEQNQLWFGGCGFGCDPNLNGRMVSAICLADGECSEWRRENFLGILKPELLPDWAKIRLAALPVSTAGTKGVCKYMAYSFLADGRHGPGLPLRDENEVMAYLACQKDYQYKILICDGDDYGVLEIVENKVTFPGPEDAAKLLERLREQEQAGGIQMI